MRMCLPVDGLWQRESPGYGAMDTIARSHEGPSALLEAMAAGEEVDDSLEVEPVARPPSLSDSGAGILDSSRKRLWARKLRAAQARSSPLRASLSVPSPSRLDSVADPLLEESMDGVLGAACGSMPTPNAGMRRAVSASEAPTRDSSRSVDDDFEPANGGSGAGPPDDVGSGSGAGGGAGVPLDAEPSSDSYGVDIGAIEIRGEIVAPADDDDDLEIAGKLPPVEADGGAAVDVGAAAMSGAGSADEAGEDVAPLPTRGGVRWGDVTTVEGDGSQTTRTAFTPSSEHATPEVRRREELRYVPPEERKDSMAPASSVARPDFDDSLRRVSVILYQHIHRGELQRQGRVTRDGELVLPAMTKDAAEISDLFHEALYVAPRWRYRFVRLPRATSLSTYVMEAVEVDYPTPSAEEIYTFARHLFTTAQLSAECSIVCLVYVERLMEIAGLLLLGTNWRPILLCGMLMASKVWQDLSSWNVEFSTVYPQYSLASVNRLERAFLQTMRWDLYISGSVYAKYYFALRSMSEKKNFRRRYISMMAVQPPNMRRISVSLLSCVTVRGNI